MKKLIIVAAAAIVGIAANAAAVDWKTSTALYDGTGGTTTQAGTAYLVLSSYSQSTLLTDLRDGKDFATLMTANSIKSGTLGSNGKFASTITFDYGNGGDTLSAYVAVLVDDNIYLSATSSKTLADVGNTAMGYMLSTNSKNAALDTEFSAAGWYTTSVPEPTSGLMLLLGIAGLALKRKCA